MPVWMTHPKHGRTPAIGAEVEWNKAHGWVIEPPRLKTQPVVEPVHVEPVSSDDLRERYRTHFGEYPHHRMKRETIERALQE